MTGASRARPDDRPRIPYVGRTNPNLSLSLSLLGLRSGFEPSGLDRPGRLGCRINRDCARRGWAAMTSRNGCVDAECSTSAQVVVIIISDM